MSSQAEFDFTRCIKAHNVPFSLSFIFSHIQNKVFKVCERKFYVWRIRFGGLLSSRYRKVTFPEYWYHLGPIRRQQTVLKTETSQVSAKTIELNTIHCCSRHILAAGAMLICSVLIPIILWAKPYLWENSVYEIHYRSIMNVRMFADSGRHIKLKISENTIYIFLTNYIYRSIYLYIC